MAAAERSRAGGSSLRRVFDFAYLGFFALHLVIMFVVDLVPLYPDAVKPAVYDSIREFYINTYQDKFFTDPPFWFSAYIIIEAVYHVPLSLWAVGALAKDHPMVPAHLLTWAVLTFITTLTCLLEVWGWEDRSDEQKWNLSLLYGPYAAFAAFMGLDMFYRLRGALVKAKRD